MHIDYAFIADYAQDAGGKVSALGIGWTDLFAATVPVQHPLMTYVASMSFAVSEAGTKNVELRMLDADGGDVVPPLTAEMEFAPLPNTLGGRVHIILNFNGVVFPRFGQYAISLVVQGNEVAHTPFAVVESVSTN